MTSTKILAAVLCLFTLTVAHNAQAQEEEKKTKTSSWTIAGVHKKKTFKIQAVTLVPDGLGTFAILSNQSAPVVGFLKPGESHIWLIVDRKATPGQVPVKAIKDPESLPQLLNAEARKAAKLPVDKALPYAYAVHFANDTPKVARYSLSPMTVIPHSALGGTLQIKANQAGKRLSLSLSLLFKDTQIAGHFDAYPSQGRPTFQEAKQEIHAFQGKKSFTLHHALLTGEDHADFLVLSNKKEFKMGSLAPNEIQIWIFLERNAKSGAVLPLKTYKSHDELFSYVDISTRKKLNIPSDKNFGFIHATRFQNNSDKAMKFDLKGKEVLEGCAQSGTLQLKSYSPYKLVQGKFTLHFKDLQIFGTIDIARTRRR